MARAFKFEGGEFFHAPSRIAIPSMWRAPNTPLAMKLSRVQD
jgi:hypothetical protein